MEDVRVVKVEKDSGLAGRLLAFVETCSWMDAREHIAWMIANWVFTEWETMFAASVEGDIVGMASLMKTDYYPLPEIRPWVSSIFVSEEYRGRRISERLVDFANKYAVENGFDRTYIPTGHIGLYEKYGYRFLCEITNYGGGKERLLVKKLS